MSGIAKPCIKFSTASVVPGVNPNAQREILLPVDWIYNMEKVDIAASPLNNNKPTYLIQVTLVPAIGSITRVEKISFDTSTARDTAFAAAETLIATTI